MIAFRSIGSMTGAFFSLARLAAFLAIIFSGYFWLVFFRIALTFWGLSSRHFCRRLYSGQGACVDSVSASHGDVFVVLAKILHSAADGKDFDPSDCYHATVESEHVCAQVCRDALVIFRFSVLTTEETLRAETITCTTVATKGLELLRDSTRRTKLLRTRPEGKYVRINRRNHGQPPYRLIGVSWAPGDTAPGLMTRAS